jgi:hypothetical protein
MGPDALQQPTSSAGDHPGGPDHEECRGVLFGCLEAAAWIVSVPQGSELAACEADLDVLLNDTLARVPPDCQRHPDGGWRA